MNILKSKILFGGVFLMMLGYAMQYSKVTEEESVKDQTLDLIKLLFDEQSLVTKDDYDIAVKEREKKKKENKDKSNFAAFISSVCLIFVIYFLFSNLK